MKGKVVKTLAFLGAIFWMAFAVVFTIGFYVKFKEPFNILSLLFLALGISFAAVVWYIKKREKNTQELLDKLNGDMQDDQNQNEQEIDQQDGAAQDEHKDDIQTKE